MASMHESSRALELLAGELVVLQLYEIIQYKTNLHLSFCYDFQKHPRKWAGIDTSKLSKNTVVKAINPSFSRKANADCRKSKRFCGLAASGGLAMQQECHLNVSLAKWSLHTLELNALLGDPRQVITEGLKSIDCVDSYADKVTDRDSWRAIIHGLQSRRSDWRPRRSMRIRLRWST